MKKKQDKKHAAALLQKLDRGLSLPQAPEGLLKPDVLEFPDYPKHHADSLSEPETPTLDMFEHLQGEDVAAPAKTVHATRRPPNLPREKAEQATPLLPAWLACPTPSLADKGFWYDDGTDAALHAETSPTSYRMLRDNPIRLFLDYLLDPSTEEESITTLSESAGSPRRHRRHREPKRRHHRKKTADEKGEKKIVVSKKEQKVGSKRRIQTDDDKESKGLKHLDSSSTPTPTSSRRSADIPYRPTISAAGAIQIAREGDSAGSGFAGAPFPGSGVPPPYQIPLGGVGLAGGNVYGVQGGGLPLPGVPPGYYPIKPTLEHHYAPAGLTPFAAFQYPTPPKEPKPIVVHLHQHGGKDGKGEVSDSTKLMGVNVHEPQLKEGEAVSIATAATLRKLQEAQEKQAQQPQPIEGLPCPPLSAAQPFGPAPPGSYMPYSYSNAFPPSGSPVPLAGGYPPSPSHLKLGFEGAVNVDPAFLGKRRSSTTTSYSSSSESTVSKRRSRKKTSRYAREERRKRRLRRMYRSEKSLAENEHKCEATDSHSITTGGTEHKTSYLVRKERRRLTKKLLQQLYYHPDAGGNLVERTLQDLLPLLQPHDRQKLVRIINDYRRSQPVISTAGETKKHKPGDILQGPPQTDYHGHVPVDRKGLMNVPVSYLSSSSTTSLSSLSTRGLIGEIRNTERVARKHDRAVLRGEVGDALDRTTAIEVQFIERALQRAKTDEMLRDVLASPLDAIRSQYIVPSEVLSPKSLFFGSGNVSPTAPLSPPYRLHFSKDEQSYTEPQSLLLPVLGHHAQRIRNETSPLDYTAEVGGHTSGDTPARKPIPDLPQDTKELHNTAQLLQVEVQRLLHKIGSIDTRAPTFVHEPPASCMDRPAEDTVSNAKAPDLIRSRSSSIASEISSPRTIPQINVSTIPFATEFPADQSTAGEGGQPKSTKYLGVPGVTSYGNPEATISTTSLRTAHVAAETPVTLELRGTATMEGDTRLLSEMGRVIGIDSGHGSGVPLYAAPMPGYPVSYPAQLDAPQATTDSQYRQDLMDRSSDDHPDYVAELRMPEEEQEERRGLAPVTYLPPPRRSQLPPDAGSPLPLSSLAWGGAGATEATVSKVTSYPSDQAHFTKVEIPMNNGADVHPRHRFEQPAANWEALGMLAGTEDISQSQRQWQRSLRPYLDIPWRKRVSKTFDIMCQRINAQGARSSHEMSRAVTEPTSESLDLRVLASTDSTAKNDVEDIKPAASEDELRTASIGPERLVTMEARTELSTLSIPATSNHQLSDISFPTFRQVGTEDAKSHRFLFTESVLEKNADDRKKTSLPECVMPRNDQKDMCDLPPTPASFDMSENSITAGTSVNGTSCHPSEELRTYRSLDDSSINYNRSRATVPGFELSLSATSGENSNSCNEARHEEEASPLLIVKPIQDAEVVPAQSNSCDETGILPDTQQQEQENCPIQNSTAGSIKLSSVQIQQPCSVYTDFLEMDKCAMSPDPKTLMSCTTELCETNGQHKSMLPVANVEVNVETQCVDKLPCEQLSIKCNEQDEKTLTSFPPTLLANDGHNITDYTAPIWNTTNAATLINLNQPCSTSYAAVPCTFSATPLPGSRPQIGMNRILVQPVNITPSETSQGNLVIQPLSVIPSTTSRMSDTDRRNTLAGSCTRAADTSRSIRAHNRQHNRVRASSPSSSSLRTGGNDTQQYPVICRTVHSQGAPCRPFRRRTPSRSPSRSASKHSSSTVRNFMRMYIIPPSPATVDHSIKPTSDPLTPSKSLLHSSVQPTIIAKGLIDVPVFRHRFPLSRGRSPCGRRWT